MRQTLIQRRWSPEDVLGVARHMWDLLEYTADADRPAIPWERLSPGRRWVLMQDATAAMERVEQREQAWSGGRARG